MFVQCASCRSGAVLSVFTSEKSGFVDIEFLVFQLGLPFHCTFPCQRSFFPPLPSNSAIGGLEQSAIRKHSKKPCRQGQKYLDYYWKDHDHGIMEVVVNRHCRLKSIRRGSDRLICEWGNVLKLYLRYIQSHSPPSLLSHVIWCFTGSYSISWQIERRRKLE